MVNFEVFCRVISSSINLSFLKSDKVGRWKIKEVPDQVVPNFGHQKGTPRGETTRPPIPSSGNV